MCPHVPFKQPQFSSMGWPKDGEPDCAPPTTLPSFIELASTPSQLGGASDLSRPLGIQTLNVGEQCCAQPTGAANVDEPVSQPAGRTVSMPGTMPECCAHAHCRMETGQVRRSLARNGQF